MDPGACVASVVREVALQGPYGSSVSDVWTVAEQRTGQPLDSFLQGLVWQWIAQNPAIVIGIPLGDGMGASKDHRPIPKSEVVGKPVADLQRAHPTVRVYAIEDVQWRELAQRPRGSLGGLAWDLLCAASHAGPSGLTAVELRQQTGQDARSISGRIEMLVEIGLARRFHVTEKGASTSRMVVARFLSQRQGETQQPARVTAEGWNHIEVSRRLVDLCKSGPNGVRLTQDLVEELGFRSARRGLTRFRALVRRLSDRGYIQRVDVFQVEDPSKRYRCLQYLKDFADQEESAESDAIEGRDDNDNEDNEDEDGGDDLEDIDNDNIQPPEINPQVNIGSMIVVAERDLQQGPVANLHYPLVHQIYDFVAETGKRGAPAMDIYRHITGQGYHKYLSRVLEAMSATPRQGPTGHMGLVRAVDFVGRTKFYRYFTRVAFSSWHGQPLPEDWGQFGPLKRPRFTSLQHAQQTVGPLPGNVTVLENSQGRQWVSFQGDELNTHEGRVVISSRPQGRSRGRPRKNQPKNPPKQESEGETKPSPIIGHSINVLERNWIGGTPAGSGQPSEAFIFSEDLSEATNVPSNHGTASSSPQTRSSNLGTFGQGPSTGHESPIRGSASQEPECVDSSKRELHQYEPQDRSKAELHAVLQASGRLIQPSAPSTFMTVPSQENSGTERLSASLPDQSPTRASSNISSLDVNPASNLAPDSLARAKRKEWVLELVREAGGVTEGGNSMQKLLNDRYSADGAPKMDRKTFNRTVASLVAMGDISQVIVAIPGRPPRHLLVDPNMDLSDPKVLEAKRQLAEAPTRPKYGGPHTQAPLMEGEISVLSANLDRPRRYHVLNDKTSKGKRRFGPSAAAVLGDRALAPVVSTNPPPSKRRGRPRKKPVPIVEGLLDDFQSSPISTQPIGGPQVPQNPEISLGATDPRLPEDTNPDEHDAQMPDIQVDPAFSTPEQHHQPLSSSGFGPGGPQASPDRDSESPSIMVPTTGLDSGITSEFDMEDMKMKSKKRTRKRMIDEDMPEVNGELDEERLVHLVVVGRELYGRGQQIPWELVVAAEPTLSLGSAPRRWGSIRNNRGGAERLQNLRDEFNDHMVAGYTAGTVLWIKDPESPEFPGLQYYLDFWRRAAATESANGGEPLVSRADWEHRNGSIIIKPGSSDPWDPLESLYSATAVSFTHTEEVFVGTPLGVPLDDVPIDDVDFNPAEMKVRAVVAADSGDSYNPESAARELAGVPERAAASAVDRLVALKLVHYLPRDAEKSIPGRSFALSERVQIVLAPKLALDTPVRAQEYADHWFNAVIPEQVPPSVHEALLVPLIEAVARHDSVKLSHKLSHTGRLTSHYRSRLIDKDQFEGDVLAQLRPGCKVFPDGIARQRPTIMRPRALDGKTFIWQTRELSSEYIWLAVIVKIVTTILLRPGVPMELLARSLGSVLMSAEVEAAVGYLLDRGNLIKHDGAIFASPEWYFELK